MRAEEQFEALGLEESEAIMLATALRFITMIPAEKLAKAIETIDRCESFGPFYDPTFFVRTPGAWKNGAANKQLFRALHALRVLLPELPVAAPQTEASDG